MKRISMLAAAALVVAGAELHAQAAKQDTTHKTHAPVAKHEAKAPGKSADKSGGEAKPAGEAKAAAKSEHKADSAKTARHKGAKKDSSAKAAGKKG